MAIKAPLLLFLLALAAFWASTHGATPTHYSVPFNRTSFPSGFIFGAGSAAYQSEGAAFKDGKGLNIWDSFTREQSGKIADGSNGDVAEDIYHRYKEDIQLVKKIGLDSFRFSISWSRLLPKGKVSGGVNPKAVIFYNNLINELLSNGIKPFVTLLHFDTPLALQDEYGGFLSPNIVEDYVGYVNFCFKTFGDRVKHWVTMNEPNGWTIYGYSSGTFAPGRCSSYAGNCTAGNSATEPYIVAHHLLLAHASAVKLYRDKYKPYQKGEIGITIVTHWFMPKYQTSASIKAASRALFLLWFAHPITFGDYPESMKVVVNNRLPKFTDAQSKLLKGSIDFLSVNYYTSNYAESAPLANGVNVTYVTDRATTLTRMADANNSSLPIQDALKDSLRIRYHYGHLSYLLKAIKEGVNVKGYYVWSFLDDFEWDAGYTVRFGLTYIDFKNNLKRYLKYSAYWFKMFLLK
uniref:Beta-glucosidase n=1 Tax=Fagus sylvatica TaxID=28930 RepID=A0A2N9F884_FAGSY